jgi:hypothetical protein
MPRKWIENVQKNITKHRKCQIISRIIILQIFLVKFIESIKVQSKNLFALKPNLTSFTLQNYLRAWLKAINRKLKFDYWNTTRSQMEKQKKSTIFPNVLKEIKFLLCIVFDKDVFVNDCLWQILSFFWQKESRNFWIFFNVNSTNLVLLFGFFP